MSKRVKIDMSGYYNPPSWEEFENLQKQNAALRELCDKQNMLIKNYIAKQECICADKNFCWKTASEFVLQRAKEVLE